MDGKKSILFILVNEKNHFEVLNPVLRAINKEADVQLWSFFELTNVDIKSKYKTKSFNLIEKKSLLKYFKNYLRLLKEIKKNNFDAIVIPHFLHEATQRLLIYYLKKGAKAFILQDGLFAPDYLDISKNYNFYNNLFPIKSSTAIIRLFEKIFIKTNKFFKYKERIFLLCWGELDKLYYSKYKFNNFIITGSPKYENRWQMSNEKEGFNASKSITIFTQPFPECKVISYDDYLNKLKEFVIELSNKFNKEIIIKLHPDQNIMHFKPISLNHKIKVIDSGNNLEIINNSDIVIGYDSTVLLDAFILKKHVIIADLWNLNSANIYTELLKIKYYNSSEDIINNIDEFYKGLYTNNITYAHLEEIIFPSQKSSEVISDILLK